LRLNVVICSRRSEAKISSLSGDVVAFLQHLSGLNPYLAKILKPRRRWSFKFIASRTLRGAV